MEQLDLNSFTASPAFASALEKARGMDLEVLISASWLWGPTPVVAITIRKRSDCTVLAEKTSDLTIHPGAAGDVAAAMVERMLGLPRVVRLAGGER
ncbi:MAG TPA: hypothetical protein VGG07_14220 [Solirubrobacteraceae bacterium]